MLYVKNVHHVFIIFGLRLLNTSRVEIQEDFIITCKTWSIWVSWWKPRHRLWALSWPSLLFTESSLLAHSARQTPRQTRVLQGLAFIQQPTFIRDQFKALWLPSPLPFPELHLQREYVAYSKSCSRKSLLWKAKSVTRIHSAASLAACLIINQLNFSSARTTDTVVGTVSPR